MKEQNRNEAAESRQVCYETLEPWARMKVQEFLQQLLEEEVTALLGREKHARREKTASVDAPGGSRNGYGKPRKFSMMNGTVTVQRPRVRGRTATQSRGAYSMVDPSQTANRSVLAIDGGAHHAGTAGPTIWSRRRGSRCPARTADRRLGFAASRGRPWRSGCRLPAWLADGASRSLKR